MISLILAAALQTSPSVLTQSQSSAQRTRYVRLTMTVKGYGIDGTGEMLVDRQTGQYTERVDIGPQSFSQGFDGARAWQADATGMAAVQGNDVDAGTIRAWGYAFAFPQHVRAQGTGLQFDGVPQPLRFTVDPATQRVQRLTVSNGIVDEVATFSNYRAFAGGVVAPETMTFTDDNGTWTGRVTGVAAPQSVPAGAFAPPPRPHDGAITGGITSVPFMTATEILIPVRINNGPTMHFILDTGGQNVLLASAVKRLGLHPIGHGTVGGAGSGVIPTSFLTVQSVRVGGAQLRNQPFLVLDAPLLKGIDGIVGFELLSRFAARIDYRTNTLTLASSMPASWTGGTAPTPFSFRSHQPQVEGAIDGIPGALTIDTGNSGTLDINSPFARKHNLWAYYHAALPKKGALVGVGGSVKFANVTVKKLRLGTATVQNVYGDLTAATGGIEIHPAIAANVGEGVFRQFTLVLDYPHSRMYFTPGGIADLSGVIVEPNGDRIVVRQVRTHIAMRAGVRPGMTLTGLNGKAVSAREIAAVRAALQGAPGTRVHLVFNGRKRVTLMLLNYL